MYRLLVLLFAFAALQAGSQGITPGNTLPVKSTIPVSENDKKEDIIVKAAHVVPTANQYDALKNEFIAFIHFGPNSFTRMEWGNGKEDPKIFDLKELHTDQWCQAMKAAGMKMVIITAKHHDGFVLWQSRYTKHGIMSSPYQDGKGDILKELVASCEKYGLKVGIYLSPADLFQIENEEGLYGNLSKYTKRTIPRAVEGRPFKNKTTFEAEVDDYNEYFMNQLFELLTEYGPIHEVWFDGAHPKTKGGQKYNYLAWKKLISELAPKAVVFGKQDIRWCGNEAGGTRPTEWNVIPYQEDPAQMNNFDDLTNASLGSREDLYKGKFLHYQQAETNTSIREGWFYRDDEHQKVRSADDVFDIYERSVGGNSTFLLNIPPNREGKFSPTDVAVLNEVGKRIKETYTRNLFKAAKGPKEVLDADVISAKLREGANPEIIISTPAPVTINRLVLQEAVTTHGERVEKHALDVWINNQWKEIAVATNIGYKRILRFPEVTASKFRVRILESRLTPAISNISAHYYRTRPPQLQFSRTKNGLVSIEPLQPAFNWNPNGENASKNINTGYEVYYTTDGSKPGKNSLKYKAPFNMGPGKIRAISFSKNVSGEESATTLGILKEDWKLLGSSSEIKRRPASAAFDENPKSYWQSAEEEAHFISLDLGKNYDLTGFAYTPQNHHGEGMMAKGIIKVSADGKTWQDAETFEFGNLVNDPSKRNHYFKKTHNTRYIRIDSAEIAAKGKTLAIAELDFFVGK
ncbi:alpha-1,3/4-fucosidase [Emticicia sp. CRIBPO]|uniref:alpha-L-fucosidase n=1 Tax=Emticicia sp. CRIBPO TaxID=2683258 RepID=UPI001412F772|nr:alpha-L-fucosidase [Emticicia sp. CRIBPO]NBA84787.1 alpha-1,3/4-fucosidase [Emticicia sp. CRIBPO]